MEGKKEKQNKKHFSFVLAKKEINDPLKTVQKHFFHFYSPNSIINKPHKDPCHLNLIRSIVCFIQLY